MESNQSLGDTDEYGSSESGWTMYIGSPFGKNGSHGCEDYFSVDKKGKGQDYVDDDEQDDEDEDEDKDVDDDDDDDDYESDDSMASDASSGPRYQELPSERSEKSVVMDQPKQKAINRISKVKHSRQIKKSNEKHRKARKALKESVLKENSAASRFYKSRRTS